ncbi:MAG TPA: acetyl-CoA sensor PanZ family protein [Marinospirillum sp.]|uniref:acetyl-CoA sensor PanZ family protein n=1 Tax=Marinospirillum sp. TaxID=2183934 RepID=UPI002B467241|nr:acetyl-CoA sensor PanZ family protein [Marinospirillum sp.]HKM14726.1 acetyl-CoA sensor PanZ family protein [Marinospirillum sp.]
MPVFLIKADAKTLADQPSWLVDLHKIYTEIFAEDSQTLVSTALIQPNSWFAGALFNDHLLGAVLVTEQVNERAGTWSLSHLSVRKVTQRRGVATRLLHLLAAKAAEKNAVLTFIDSPMDAQNSAAVQALAIKLGYAGE